MMTKSHKWGPQVSWRRAMAEDTLPQIGAVIVTMAP